MNYLSTLHILPSEEEVRIKKEQLSITECKQSLQTKINPTLKNVCQFLLLNIIADDPVINDNRYN